MQAMVLRRADAPEGAWLVREDVDEAPLPPGHVRIAVEACGVCRTDLHLVEGEVGAPLPLIPGHQAGGRIVQLGDGVTSHAVGDLVGVGWLAGTCGECPYCTSDRENLCERARFTGRDVAGGYAQQIVADARFAFALPAGIPARDAAPLLCAGVIGYRSLRLSGVASGGRLGLVGFGASAHLVLQVALHERCAVYVFTREQHHRELALGMGARWAGAVADEPGVALDGAITFAPAGELVAQMLPKLARGGTLAINAIHMSDIGPLPFESLYWERSVRSVANYTRRDAEEFLAVAARIPVRAQTEEYPLAAANDALLRIKRGQVRGAAVLTLP